MEQQEQKDPENDVASEMDESDDHATNREKENKYFMSLETFLFNKNIKKYSNNTNIIDKKLASLLSDAVDTIAEFLSKAKIQEDDETLDVIPTFENGIAQDHRYYYCKICNQSVKATSLSFNEHFFGNNHLTRLRKYEKNLSGQKIKHQSVETNESTESLENGNNVLEKSPHTKPKKEPLNSAPGVPPVNDQLPKKMREFLAHADLNAISVSLINEGRQIQLTQVYKRVCDLLEARLACRFPNVKAYPFGSMVIGCGRAGGDLGMDNCKQFLII